MPRLHMHGPSRNAALCNATNTKGDLRRLERSAKCGHDDVPAVCLHGKISLVLQCLMFTDSLDYHFHLPALT